MKAAGVSIKIQKNNPKKIVLLGFATIFFGTVIFLIFQLLPGKRTPPEPPSLSSSSDVAQAPSWIEYRERLRPGDTIGTVLANYGLDPKRIHQLYEQTKPVYDLRFVKAGHELRITASEQGQLLRLEYDLNDTQYILISAEEEKFSASLEAHPVQTEVRMLCGTINSNPILAFNQQGEGDSLALSFSDLFAWDVDFYVDLREGDCFKVIFEKRFLKGKFIGYGNILAAELVNRGKKFQAFRYVIPQSQKAGYYDAEGRSIQKEFIKSPIKWARITSRFTGRRLHPIHKVYRAHYGVDYAAPVGTPVQATADGTVTYVGTNGASGRMVKIRHRNGYETMYLHLKSYGPGIRVGARVEGGDIIGYVGSSGESTGPHLDYRITLRGSYINPLSWKFEPVAPLPEENLEDFRRAIEPYRLLLEDPLLTVSPGIF